MIPVINEDGRLLRQLERLQEIHPPVDLIIAGSTEPEVLDSLGVTAVLEKLGAGRLSAQLRMAFKCCLFASYEGVVTMDGSRKDGSDEYSPLSRYLAIRAIRGPLTSIGARHWYTDTTNGFRGHSGTLLADPRVAVFRDVFDTYELLAYQPVQAARQGFQVTKVPVTRSYPTRQSRPTKIVGVGAHMSLLRILLDAARRAYRP